MQQNTKLDLSLFPELLTLISLYNSVSLKYDCPILDFSDIYN